MSNHVNFKGVTAHKLFGLPKMPEQIHEGISLPLNDLFREDSEGQTKT